MTDKDDKEKKPKIKEPKRDLCPVCGGKGSYGTKEGRVICHACHGIGSTKIADKDKKFKLKAEVVEEEKKPK